MEYHDLSARNYLSNSLAATTGTVSARATLPVCSNPFSVLSVMAKRLFDNYWFATGTPTFLAEMLKKNRL